MPLAGHSILLVDDDPLVAMNHSDMLEDAGCQVVRADGVVQGWNALRARPWDAVVLDHDLGDGKGWDIVKLMHSASLSIPVVYLSAAGPATLAAALELPSVVKALAKPVSKEVLLGALEAVLKDAAPRAARYPKLVGDEEREMLLGDLYPSGSKGKEA